MFSRSFPIRSVARHLSSATPTVAFSRTQALVPTLPLPPLNQTIAKFTRLTSAILPVSQAEVCCGAIRLAYFILFHSSQIRQEAAAAARKFMQVSTHRARARQSSTLTRHRDQRLRYMRTFRNMQVTATHVHPLPTLVVSNRNACLNLTLLLPARSFRPRIFLHCREMGQYRIPCLQVAIARFMQRR